MAQALSECFVGEEDPKFSPKAFREKMNGKKVSAKKIKEFVSDTLQETKLQTEISNAEKQAKREDDKVALERERNNFLEQQAIRQQTALESQLEKDLAQIAMQREKIAKDEKISEDAKKVRLKEIDDRAVDRREKYDLDVKEIDSKKPLMDAQIKYYESLGEKSLAETALTDAERLSYEDTDGLIGNELALTNGVAQLIGMDSAAFQALDVNARKSLIDERLKQVRLGGGNLEDPSLQPLKKLSDLYLNQSFLRMSPEEFSAYQQHQAAAPVVPPNRLQTSFGGQYGGMLGG